MAKWASSLEGLGIVPDFWQGKKVFVTGHTGFKGCWLTLWLKSLGAEVYGYALNPSTTPNFFNEANVLKSLAASTIADIQDDRSSWEGEPLVKLAADAELMSFEHAGFWQPMDTLREKNMLEDLWQSGKAPWKVWE